MGLYSRVYAVPQAPAPTPTVEPTRASERGQALLHGFEGFRAEAYKDSVGVWTIGYGTTVSDGTPVQKGDHVTRAEADRLFEHDLQRFEKAVRALITVPLTQSQFDALVSFAYNVGVNALRTSTLRRYLNAGRYDEAADQFLRWNKGGGRVIAGLTHRRKAERKLFKE